MDQSVMSSLFGCPVNHHLQYSHNNHAGRGGTSWAEITQVRLPCAADGIANVHFLKWTYINHAND